MMLDPASKYLPVHFSNLKHFAQCAAKYQYACLHPSEDTRDFRIGRAFHSLVLGGKRVVCYEGRRDERSKDWQAFSQEHAHDEILIASEFSVATAMAESVLNHDTARKLLERCIKKEVTVEGTQLGLPCEGRVDGLGDAVIVELKSDSVAQPDRWQRRAQFLGYAAQLDWYRTLLGDLGEECFAIVSEKSPPHLVVVHHATPRLLEEGRRCWRLWIEQLKGCIESDVWPGYAESIVEWDASEFEMGESIGFEEDAA